ncbi:MAG: hypothetical protein JSW51_00395 [Gemmatimonadota bacterium]|nr:MAG: hypothetical protein JSW51_00395 [Gemmatimonadota bacterium]
MKRNTYKLIAYLLLLSQVAMTILPSIAEAQRRGAAGGRSARSSANVNRSSAARSGSTNQAAQPSRSTAQTRSNRSTAQRTASRNTARRTSARRTSHARARTRTRSRRVYRSRRYRYSRWRHHRYWRHRRYYRGFWVSRVLITTAAFVAIANSSNSTTYVVYGTTYVRVNPWYRKALHDGEEVYVLTSAPVGWETETLPDGAETIEVDGATYYYADWSFFQEASGGGYVVVEPPVGAEVSAIPEEAVAHEEGDVTLYQFDNSYFTKATNDAGREVYLVEPAPPEEEIDEIPADAISFVADGETFYYVNFNLYVEYEENGQTGYVNGEPEVGAQLDELPEGTTTIEEDGRTFYQFDMVFFEEVEDEDGNPFYEVIDSPDGSEVVELEAAG